MQAQLKPNIVKQIFQGVNPFSKKDSDIKLLFVLKKILAFVVIYFISMFIAEGIAIAAHFMMGYNILQGEMLPTQAMQLMKYYGYAVHIIVAILYCIWIEKRTVKSMGFQKSFMGYFKGIALSVILLGAALGAIMLLGGIQYEGVNQDVKYSIILGFLGAFIIQGAMEEVLCRGFLMTSLCKKVSVPIAITLSAIIFAIPHFSSLFSGDTLYSVIGVINLLLMSTIFSLYILNDGNIWVACSLHSFWNFILFNVIGLNLSGIEDSEAIFQFTMQNNSILNGGEYGIEASIVTSVVLAICVAIQVLRYQKKKNRTNT